MKKIYLSKTIIAAVIGIVTLIIDAAYNLGISETVDQQLNSIFITEGEQVTRVNFPALLSLLSMILLRLVTKKPVTVKRTKKKSDLLEKLQKQQTENNG